MITTTVVASGHKNLTLDIIGFVDSDTGPMALIKGLDRVKMASALWILQEKLTLLLWWDLEHLIFPMESRGAFKFERDLEPPKEWDGTLRMSVLNSQKPDDSPKHVRIILDFDK